MGHQNVLEVDGMRHRRQILEGVVRHLGIKPGIDGVACGDLANRVAVGGGARHHFGAQNATGASPIFHDHRLAQTLTDAGRDQSADGIQDAACG